MPGRSWKPVPPQRSLTTPPIPTPVHCWMPCRVPADGRRRSQRRDRATPWKEADMKTFPKWTTAIRRTTAALATVGLLALAGCAQPGVPSDAADRPFTVNWAASLTNIDPAFVCAGNENSFATNFYARLVRLDQEAQADGTRVAINDPERVSGDLATSWTVSPDGKSYTFSLHPGAKFANGNPLDAEAVRYSIMRNLTIGGCGALGLQIGLTDPPLISDVVGMDPQTVQIGRASCGEGEES